jgi:hypothetical protein
MRWLTLSTSTLVLAAVKISMMSETAERSWPLAALWAAAMHWVSGILIIVLASVLRLSLPEKWLHLRPWESDGSIYCRLGIESYKKALLGSPFGANPFLKFHGRRSQLPELEQFTRTAEMGHLTLLVASTGVIAVASLNGYWRTALFLTVLNVPWNVYPVLLQRHTRSRLMRIRRRWLATAQRECR